MKVIALEVEKEGSTSDDFQPYLKDEAAAVWELYKNNIVREIYFRDDQSTAVLILECKDTAEAESILAQLPLVQKGLIKFELLPLKPYPGFERLFR